MTEATTTPQQIIYDAFAGAAAAGWATGEINYRMAGKTSEYTMFALDAAGTRTYPRVRGFALAEAVEQLRVEAYQPGRGAWFSAKIIITAQGKMTIDFDYDHEPEWRTPVVALTYAEEQQRYPRDDDHQPEWYAAKLAEAAG